jgi:arsenate reductase
MSESTRPVILFLCTANACRSQMAEALARVALPHADCFSAGVRPGSRVDPNAIIVLGEKGLVLTNPTNKSIADAEALFAPRRADFVITVCGNADKEPCPIYNKAQKKIHRGFRDPPHVAAESGLEGDAALACYREVRDEIEAFVRDELTKLCPAPTPTA